MNYGKVLISVLAGIAVGATLGLLFAPEKGITTRRQLFRKGSDYLENIDNNFSDFIDDVSKKLETTKDEAISSANKNLGKVESLSEKFPNNLSKKM